MNEQGKKSEPLWTRGYISITIINFLVFFSFQMLQPTLPLYVKQLGGSDSIIGLITGLFTITALVIRPFS